MKVLVLAVIVGCVAVQALPARNARDLFPEEIRAAELERRSTSTPIPIIQWNKQQDQDGTYKTNYETGNNIVAEESGYLKTVGEGKDQSEALVQRGSYSYTSPDGQVINVEYTADETGFHATGDHLPTPPPVSEEIQKGLDLIYAGIREQQEIEAREGKKPLEQQNIGQPIERREDNRNYRQ